MIDKNFDVLKELIQQRLGANEGVSGCKIENYSSDYAYNFFYALGIDQFYVNSFGDYITVPCANDLERAQYGYSWNPKTQQPMTSWPSDLYVVAFSGPVAFAVDKNTHKVSIVFPDHNNSWCSEYLFEDLFEMFYGFAVIGGITREAKSNFSDRNRVKAQYVDHAKVELHKYGFVQKNIENLLGRLGWTS